MLGFDELHWKNPVSLYHGDRKVLSLTPNKEYLGMWRVKWPDGVLSDNFYNHTRAKENAMKWYVADFNRRDSASGTGEEAST